MSGRAGPIFCLAFVWLILVPGCRAGADDQRNTPLSNRDVIEMLKSGLSPDLVEAKIKSTRCNFDTSISELETLKTAGVPDPVLIAMVQAPRPGDSAALEAVSRTSARDWVPVLVTLPWPIVLTTVLLAWRQRLSSLLDALVQRVQSGAEIEFMGVVLGAPPPTEEPYASDVFI